MCRVGSFIYMTVFFQSMVHISLIHQVSELESIAVKLSRTLAHFADSILTAALSMTRSTAALHHSFSSAKQSMFYMVPAATRYRVSVQYPTQAKTQ